MIGTIFASLVAYAAGSFAAPAAGWEGVRFAFSREASPVARTFLIAAVESFVGFGTASLGVLLSVATATDDTATLVAASAVGLGFGVARSLRSARNAAVLEAAARYSAPGVGAPGVGTPGEEEAAEAIGERLRGIIRYAVVVRALSAALVPIVALLLL